MMYLVADVSGDALPIQGKASRSTHVPEEWQTLRFRVQWRGKQLRVAAANNGAEVMTE